MAILAIVEDFLSLVALSRTFAGGWCIAEYERESRQGQNASQFVRKYQGMHKR